MKKIKVSSDFMNDCKLVNLIYEYGAGYTGKEKWAIITDLSKVDLYIRYANEVKPYKPFVVLSIEQGNAIFDFRRNEDKFKKRNMLHGSAYGYDEGITERIEDEISEPDFISKQELQEYEHKRYQIKMQLIDTALSILTEKQHRYLIERFINGKSARTIAKEEGVSHQVVDRHLIAAIKKFEFVFSDFFKDKK